MTMHLQDLAFTDLIKSQPPGGLFLQHPHPPPFVSLIKVNKSNFNKTLRFDGGRRQKGCFLSVSFTIKQGSEGYVGESTETSWSQNGNVDSCRLEKEEEKDGVEETMSFQVVEKEHGRFNTARHLLAGAIAAAVSRLLFCFDCSIEFL